MFSYLHRHDAWTIERRNIIVALREQGWYVKEIAKLIGVSTSTIDQQLKHGRSLQGEAQYWDHIDEQPCRTWAVIALNKAMRG